MIPFPYKNYRIILDTCILGDFCSKDDNIKNQTLKLLVDLVTNQNYLYYSNVSLFEITHNLSKDKEKELLEKINPFYRYVIPESVLLKGARLNALYKSHGLNIEIPDILIASTAINDGVNMHFLITSNGKDFPKPFFREYHREYVYYGANQNNHGKVKAISYLFPDMQMINSELNAKGMGNWGDPELIINTPLAHEMTQIK